jgi:hypothetical protein
MILHDFDSPRNEVEIDPITIIDMNFASSTGGSVLTMDDGNNVRVDENPNHVALVAGFIEGNHCSIGSHSGMYYYCGKEK